MFVKLRFVVCFVVIFAVALIQGCCHKPAAAQNPTSAPTQSDRRLPADQKHFAALPEVVDAVGAALTQVKSQLITCAPPSPTSCVPDPELQSAEFDFQTVTTNDTTGGLIISIVTAEGEHVRANTTETDFMYAVPDSPNHLVAAAAYPNFISEWISKIKDFYIGLGNTQADKDLNKILPAAILEATQNLRTVKKISNPNGKDLTDRSYVITLTFSVTNSFNGGVDPSTLVLVAPELKFVRSKNYVQTLKLTFQDPKAAAAAAVPPKPSSVARTPNPSNQ